MGSGPSPARSNDASCGGYTQRRPAHDAGCTRGRSRRRARDAVGRILPGDGPARGREIQRFAGLNLLPRNPTIVLPNTKEVEELYRYTIISRKEDCSPMRGWNGGT